MMKLKILICDHHAIAQSKHMDFVLFYSKDMDQRFLFCFMFKTSNFNVRKTLLGFLLKCRFRNKQTLIFHEGSKNSGYLCRGNDWEGMREFSGIWKT